MKTLRTFIYGAEEDNYRRELTGEKIGWIPYKVSSSFNIVHRILSHPEDGPVIIIAGEVIEIDPDTCGSVYSTEEEARDGFYRDKLI